MKTVQFMVVPTSGANAIRTNMGTTSSLVDRRRQVPSCLIRVTQCNNTDVILHKFKHNIMRETIYHRIIEAKLPMENSHMDPHPIVQHVIPIPIALPIPTCKGIMAVTSVRHMIMK